MIMHNDDIPKPKNSTKTSDYKVLLFVPNIIGYIRLSLVFAAFYNISSPIMFLSLYCISIILDAFDGFAARKLNQASLFGAWFDVVIDNIGRGLLWTHLHPYFYLVSVIEWLTLVCTHQLGPDWKQQLMLHNTKSPTQEGHGSPAFVSRILSNNFRNFWGVWTVAGLHVLPLWMFGIQKNLFITHLSFLPTWTPLTGLIVLSLGRCVCFGAEIWSIWFHVSSLLIKNSSTD